MYGSNDLQTVRKIKKLLLNFHLFGTILAESVKSFASNHWDFYHEVHRHTTTTGITSGATPDGYSLVVVCFTFCSRNSFCCWKWLSSPSSDIWRDDCSWTALSSFDMCFITLSTVRVCMQPGDSVKYTLPNTFISRRPNTTMSRLSNYSPSKQISKRYFTLRYSCCSDHVAN